MARCGIENTLTPSEVWRFHHQVVRGGEDECWLWSGSKTTRGYGNFRVQREGRCVQLVASRCAYAIAHGSCPTDLFCCHRCDTPLCCNDAHLFMGTPKENVRDACNKGRIQHGVRHYNAKLTEGLVRRVLVMKRELAMSLRQIELLLGVPENHASLIVNRKLWRHVR